MADTVKLKQRVLKQKQFNVGDCISVSRLYFGIDYTSLLPDYIDRIVGRVIFVYPEAKTVKVHWDIDDTECNVKLQDIYVEDGDLPKQSIPVEPLDANEQTSSAQAAEKHCLAIDALEDNGGDSVDFNKSQFTKLLGLKSAGDEKNLGKREKKERNKISEESEEVESDDEETEGK